MGDPERTQVTTQVKGTMGYLDPEYYMTQQLTEKRDVYSFGVMLLELLTARSPIVREVKQAIDETKEIYNLQEILDPIVASSMSPRSVELFIDLALSCVHETGIIRPTISEVVKKIENIMEVAGLDPNSESPTTLASYEGASKGFVLQMTQCGFNEVYLKGLRFGSDKFISKMICHFSNFFMAFETVWWRDLARLSQWAHIWHVGVKDSWHGMGRMMRMISLVRVVPLSPERVWCGMGILRSSIHLFCS